MQEKRPEGAAPLTVMVVDDDVSALVHRDGIRECLVFEMISATSLGFRHRPAIFLAAHLP